MAFFFFFFFFPSMIRLKRLKTSVETSEKYFCRCCPLAQHEFQFSGHFSLTTNHCDQAAFSFTMNTLKKCDCLEVEVESSCHVKILGRKKRNGGGVKRGERRTRCTLSLWTWTVDTPAAVLHIVCNWLLQYWSSSNSEDICYYCDPRNVHKVTNCFKS